MGHYPAVFAGADAWDWPMSDYLDALNAIASPGGFAAAEKNLIEQLKNGPG